MLLKLSEDERETFAMRLCREIDASESVRQSLVARWDRCASIYFNDETATALNVVEGIAPYGISPWRDKCDKMTGDISGSILSVSPIVQCIEDAPQGTNEGPLEDALTQIAEKDGFARCLPRALWTGANTNIGILRARPEVDESGAVSGIDTDWFSPKHFMAYPSGFERVTQCKTVGHRTYLGLWEVEERQRDGRYYKYDEPIAAGDDPDAYDRLPGRFDRTEDDVLVSSDDGYVEIWECIALVRHKSEWKRLIFTVARTSQKLLSCQEYEYSRPWYEIVRFCRNEKKIFSNDSPANSVQGYCLGVQDLWNAIIAGFYMTGYGVAWMKGYLGPQQAKQMAPGEIIPLGPDGAMGVLDFRFDPQAALAAADYLERKIEATIGVSANQAGEKVPDMTATEASIVASAGQQRQATYIDAVSEAVEGVFGLYLEFLRAHPEELGEAYGGAVAALDPAMLEKQYTLKVTGSTGASNPQLLLQKLQMLMQFAMNPASTLDAAKVEERTVDAMDLPFDAASLEKDALTQWKQVYDQLAQMGVDPMAVLADGMEGMVNGQLGAAEGAIQEPGMGGFEGVPEGAPGLEAGGTDPMLAGAFAGGPGGDIDPGMVPEAGGGGEVPYGF